MRAGQAQNREKGQSRKRKQPNLGKEAQVPWECNALGSHMWLNVESGGRIQQTMRRYSESIQKARGASEANGKVLSADCYFRNIRVQNGLEESQTGDRDSSWKDGSIIPL